jgi:hypothetical protein
LRLVLRGGRWALCKVVVGEFAQADARLWRALIGWRTRCGCVDRLVMRGRLRRLGRLRLARGLAAEADEAGVCRFAFGRVRENFGEVMIILRGARMIACHLSAITGFKILGGRISLRLRRHQAQ